MGRQFISLVSVFFLFLINSTTTLAADSVSGYTLHTGDTLQVSVWGEDKLQSPSLVLPDGSITYPLAGTVKVMGLTATQVEETIAEKLKPYLPEPQVSVVITAIGGNKIYVIGKVKKPGEFLMTGPLNVLQALSLAGSFDKFADKGGIKIMRETDAGRKLIPVANYDELIKGNNLEGNYNLISGDTVLVP